LSGPRGMTRPAGAGPPAARPPPLALAGGEGRRATRGARLKHLLSLTKALSKGMTRSGPPIRSSSTERTCLSGRARPGTRTRPPPERGGPDRPGHTRPRYTPSRRSDYSLAKERRLPRGTGGLPPARPAKPPPAPHLVHPARPLAVGGVGQCSDRAASVNRSSSVLQDSLRSFAAARF